MAVRIMKKPVDGSFMIPDRSARKLLVGQRVFHLGGGFLGRMIRLLGFFLHIIGRLRSTFLGRVISLLSLFSNGFVAAAAAFFLLIGHNRLLSNLWDFIFVQNERIKSVEPLQTASIVNSLPQFWHVTISPTT